MSRTSRSDRLEGDLAALGVAELVQTLTLGRKTARVILRSGARQGAMWFRDGELTHAAEGSLYGDLAVYAMVNWHEGEFLVEYGFVSEARSITQDATFLVLEGLRRIDERSLVAAEAPAAVIARPRSSRAARAIAGAIGAAGVTLAIIATGLIDESHSIVPGDHAPVLVPAVQAPPPPVRPATSRPAAAPPAVVVPVETVSLPLIAPESPVAEEPVPLNVFVEVAPARVVEAPVVVPTSRLLLSGKSSGSGGELVLLVDGAAVFTHGPLERDGEFEAAIDVPAGERVIVARLGEHEDSVRAELLDGESRSLRITAHRRIGAPVKLKLGRAQ